MKTFSVFVFFLMILGSCSSTTKNMIKQGELTLTGGVYKDKEWSDALVFERISWFRELTLVYDVLYVPLKKESPFYMWMSESEKNKVASCSELNLYLNYTIDSRKVSHKEIMKQLKKQGYEEILIPDFVSNFKMHPNHEYLSLQVYNIKAICRDQVGERPQIVVPGFKTVTM